MVTVLSFIRQVRTVKSRALLEYIESLATIFLASSSEPARIMPLSSPSHILSLCPRTGWRPKVQRLFRFHDERLMCLVSVFVANRITTNIQKSDYFDRYVANTINMTFHQIP